MSVAALDLKPEAPAQRRRRIWLGRSFEPYVYSSPAVILIVAVMLVPLVLGVSYAFRDVKLLDPFSGG